MSYEVLEKAYNTLTAERKENVEQFIYFLIEQQKKESVFPATVKKHDADFESMIDSFMGCTHAWDNTDVMQYQQELRGDYRVE